MSLILDALNRSRQDERQVPERAPGLESPHFREPPSSTGIRWLVLLAVALCIALGVIAWLLLARPPEEVAMKRLPVAETPPAVPAPPPPAVVSPPPTTPPVTPASSEAKQDVVDLPSREAPAPASAEPDTPTPAVEDEEVAALYREPPAPAPAAAPETAPEQTAAPPPRREERPIDIQAMVTQAQAEMANRGLQDNPVPFLASLSQQFKDRVPSIMYLRHDYSGTPGKSRVVLNGKSVAPGGSLPGGIKVEEILPDSVILSYQGTRFRLRALNSWVNL